jgi:pyruvate/2-oxoglutarate dehydrogenase complex dihydrolipoamide acyltransferase (E2) component
MSLETKIEALTAAVNQLIAVMSAGSASVPQPAPVAQAQPAAPVAAPVVPAPAMPAPPTFAAPAPASAVGPAAPFSTPQELMQYVMGAYQAMGPTKGANIQGILTHLGHSNINDVKPEQYGQLYAMVEQLKAS